uniref:C2H2-type domain-containing protein n=1 Tax=Neogobius melanostomus TaxID=47308 RepID=A0A8C6TTB8_9GOBI
PSTQPDDIITQCCLFESGVLWNSGQRCSRSTGLEKQSENSFDREVCSSKSPPAQSHTDQRQRPFSCSFCPRNFTRKYYLHLHMRSHPKERLFKCSVCTKDFTRQCYLQIHLKTHRLSTVTEENREAGAGLEEQSENFFDLEDCSAESPTPQSQTDQRQRPFSCSFCPRNFTRKYYLHLHMRSHPKERLFKCSVCTKDFTRKCYLQIHLKTHSGQRQYQTKHKDQDKGGKNKKVKKSIFLQTVTEEIREDGAGLEKQSENSSLHMKTHQTERPHSCPVCAKTFTQKYVPFVHEYLKTNLDLIDTWQNTPTRDHSAARSAPRNYDPSPVFIFTQGVTTSTRPSNVGLRSTFSRKERSQDAPGQPHRRLLRPAAQTGDRETYSNLYLPQRKSHSDLTSVSSK